MKLMLIVISIVARPQLATSSALFEDRFPNMVSNQGPMRVMNISTGLELVDHLRNLKNGRQPVSCWVHFRFLCEVRNASCMVVLQP